jgi:hypothetical protein
MAAAKCGHFFGDNFIDLMGDGITPGLCPASGKTPPQA